MPNATSPAPLPLIPPGCFPSSTPAMLPSSHSPHVQPARAFQDTNWMLTLACLKCSQAPHPFSDKIWLSSSACKACVVRTRPSHPVTLRPVSFTLFCHFVLYSVIGNCPVHTSSRDFACAPGCPPLPVLCPVWWLPSMVLGPAASMSPENLLEI